MLSITCWALGKPHDGPAGRAGGQRCPCSSKGKMFVKVKMRAAPVPMRRTRWGDTRVHGKLCAWPPLFGPPGTTLKCHR